MVVGDTVTVLVLTSAGSTSSAQARFTTLSGKEASASGIVTLLGIVAGAVVMGTLVELVAARVEFDAVGDAVMVELSGKAVAETAVPVCRIGAIVELLVAEKVALGCEKVTLLLLTGVVVASVKDVVVFVADARAVVDALL